MYKRVLLKLSGEALSNGINDPFCKEHLDSVALEIKQAVKEGVQVCVVVGGGNIYRGKMGETMGRLPTSVLRMHSWTSSTILPKRLAHT